jgi:GTP-binding protein
MCFKYKYTHKFLGIVGYGFAKLSKEEQAKVSDFLTNYLSERDPLRLVVVLVDIRREPQDADREIIDVIIIVCLIRLIY